MLAESSKGRAFLRRSWGPGGALCGNSQRLHCFLGERLRLGSFAREGQQCTLRALIAIRGPHLLLASPFTPQIVGSHLTKIGELIKENMEGLEAGEATEQIKQHYTNTCNHVKALKGEGAGW